MSFGIIYVIRNSRMGATTVKVGKTNRSLPERIRELNSATSNLGQFEPLAYFPVSDIDRAESECHLALSGYRVQNNREFFEGDIQKIILTVGSIAKLFEPSAQVLVNLGGGPDGSEHFEGIEERISKLADAAKISRSEAEVQLQEDSQRVGDWAKTIRLALAAIRASKADRRVLIDIPSDRPTLVPMEIRWGDSGMEGIDDNVIRAASTSEFIPIAKIRLFATNTTAVSILLPVSDALPEQKRDKPQCVTDDGRMLDLVVVAVRLSDDVKQHYVDNGKLSRGAGDICLGLVALGFQYTESATPSQFDAPIYKYLGLGSTGPFYEAPVVVNEVMQAVAEILYADTPQARCVEISETGDRHRVQTLIRANIENGEKVGVIVKSGADEVQYYYSCCQRSWILSHAEFTVSATCPGCNENVEPFYCETFN